MGGTFLRRMLECTKWSDWMVPRHSSISMDTLHCLFNVSNGVVGERRTTIGEGSIKGWKNLLLPLSIYCFNVSAQKKNPSVFSTWKKYDLFGSLHINFPKLKRKRAKGKKKGTLSKINTILKKKMWQIWFFVRGSACATSQMVLDGWTCGNESKMWLKCKNDKLTYPHIKSLSQCETVHLLIDFVCLCVCVFLSLFTP